jgi:hypothetical protein
VGSGASFPASTIKFINNIMIIKGLKNTENGFDSKIEILLIFSGLQY